MSYFAKIKCPKCGKVDVMHLGGYGFFNVGNTTCKYCNHTFPAQANCIEMETDHPYPYDEDDKKEKKSNDKDVRIKELEDTVDKLTEENRQLKNQLKKSCGLSKQLSTQRGESDLSSRNTDYILI